MTAWQWLNENPFGAWCCVAASFCILMFTVGATADAWKAAMRMLSIRKHGWPPPHCDADGNPTETTFVEEDVP